MTDVDERTVTQFYGKYRGTVVNNIDTLRMGRIQASVPGVSTIPSTWALPCLPAGIGCGLFTVPTIGSAVWIEYEQGDPNHPIWVGGFWGSAAEVPVMSNLVPPGINGLTVQTQLGSGLLISDAPGPTGGILLKTATGAMISISDTGVTITNGKGATITLTGPTTDVNLGALTVM